MTRKNFLLSPLGLSTTRLHGSLSRGLPAGGSSTGGDGSILLRNANHGLRFDVKTGQLVSLRAASAPDQEFLQADERDPAFVIQYLDKEDSFRHIQSTTAKEIVVKSENVDKGGTVLRADFIGLGGLDLDATVTVQTSPDDPESHWSISIRNNTGLMITDVQFPFIVVSYRLAGTPGSEALLRPLASGQLMRAPKPQELEPDNPRAWQFRPERGGTAHYPGLTFAQFLAYYNDQAGVYVSCLDSSGAIKLLKPVHHRKGIRLGISHVGDWLANGQRKLEYDIVLRTFTGDWYTAAGLYREWSLKQHWAQTPLHRRKDLPEWLADSPPHIIVRIQGQLDVGPADLNVEFLPYPKIIPLLEKIAQRVEAPLVPVIMSWERPGPWIYPDCFPPAGGERSLSEFTEVARERGWHIGSFCNGTRWVVGHFWSGYDGEDYFKKQGGEKTVCRAHDQRPWREYWDQTWRPSYACCLGVPRTREIAVNFVQRLIRYGLDWVQFLDQNVGCATFPCYAKDHHHPPTPGKWMTVGMEALHAAFHRLAVETETSSQGRRRIVYSVEQAPNEYFMPNFQVCDVRVIPPGHTGHERGFLPLYSFLYHEFILIQGGFGSAPEPYHMPIRSAYNFVVGQIPGAVITGDGRLLNRDTFNWAPWDPQVGDNEDSLEMLRTTVALRRGRGRDYLTFGRMQRPAEIAGIRTISWEYGSRIHRIPAVFHSAWTSPKGRSGVVLSNWTKESQSVEVADPRLGDKFQQTVSAREMRSEARLVTGGKTSMTLPPLSCALLESESGS